jgi:FkbM family methyltransferase
MIGQLSKKLIYGITRNKTGLSRKLRHLAEMYLDNFYDNLHDFDHNGESNLLRSLQRFDIKIVFDVGCNVGEWSATALDNFKEASVHCFELSEPTFNVLLSNLTDNRSIKNNVGLSNKVGKSTFKQYAGRSKVNTLLSSATYWDDSEMVQVVECELTTGDVYCTEHSIEFVDVLKIDAEGADLFVLEGFREMLKNQRIGLIQFEYGYTHADAGHCMRNFFTLLNACGYKIGKLWSDGVEFTDFFYWLNNYKSGPNFVAVRANDVKIIDAVSIKRPPTFVSFMDPAFKTLDA